MNYYYFWIVPLAVIVCLAIFGLCIMYNPTYVTEGTIVDTGYTVHEQEGYYWIDVYHKESKIVRRVKVEGLDGYQIGDFWKAP